MNKYYTPEIEEFHIGFEYEAIKLKTIDIDKIPKGVSLDDYIKNNKLVDEWIPLTWNKYCTFEKFFNIEYNDEIITNITIPKSIRVKYLDKNDIESLGWKGQEANTVYFKKDKYRLVHWLANNEIGRDVSIYESYDGGSQEEALVRKAIIKNKSELKKLLKQLNIINE